MKTICRSMNRKGSHNIIYRKRNVGPTDYTSYKDVKNITNITILFRERHSSRTRLELVCLVSSFPHSRNINTLCYQNSECMLF